jgi:lysophospholipase L1-like esterase
VTLAGSVAVIAVAVACAAAGATGAAPPVPLSLDHRVPPRYGLDQNRDGLVDAITTSAQVSPASWTALVTVRWPNGGLCAGTYRWTIGGRPNPFVQLRNPATGLPTCTFAFSSFPQVDHPYRVNLTATRAGVTGRGQLTLTIRDLLVVGLGDSTASGEGNPDHGIAPVRWQDRRCHRSAKGFEALTASRLESASPKSSVTFVPLACSGASITTGMLGPYAGVDTAGTSTRLPPQVDAMKALVGTRPVDAVLVSIGINDLGFGNVARFCFDDGVDARAAAAVDCWTKPYPTSASPTTLQAFVRSRAAALPGRYARLDAAFGAAGIPAAKIYVTEYANATRDARGATCDPLVPYLDSRPFGYRVRGTITREEALEAENELVKPVNQALRTAAATYGWHLVSGIAAQSTTHGVCAARPWFLGVYDSLFAQHDVLGTLHPNAQGHQAAASLVFGALRPLLG